MSTGKNLKLIADKAREAQAEEHSQRETAFFEGILQACLKNAERGDYGELFDTSGYSRDAWVAFGAANDLEVRFISPGQVNVSWEAQ